MNKPIAIVITAALCALSTFVISGCNTAAAKAAMGKPNAKDKYTGFDADAADNSSRTAEKLEPVKDDTDPEKAVIQLVKQLQDKRRAYHDSGEQQLMYWGDRQGVDRIIVRQVRPLLKHPDVEVRAPAVRLTLRFGKDECIGDLIECLADEEREIRQMAFRALRSRAHRDFGFEAGGGEVARARSVQEWRQWYQAEQRSGAVQAPSVYELAPQAEPKIVPPKGKSDRSDDTASPVAPEEKSSGSGRDAGGLSRRK